LVGDSLGNVILGYEDTISVTMEDMIHHGAAVSRGAKNAMVVIHPARVAPLDFVTYSNDLSKISRMETNIITPAEKPRLIDKNLVLVFFAKKAIKLPIPVDKPASSVNKKASA